MITNNVITATGGVGTALITSSNLKTSINALTGLVLDATSTLGGVSGTSISNMQSSTLATSTAALGAVGTLLNNMITNNIMTSAGAVGSAITASSLLGTTGTAAVFLGANAG